MSTQFCVQCGEPLAPGVRFCAACGTAVSAKAAPKPSRRQAKSRRSLPWALLILIIGGALILLAGLLYQANPPAVVDVPDEHDASGMPYPGVARVSALEAKERVDAGTAVIVDVRSAQEYAKAHIPNALSMPLDDLQSRYKELSPKMEIITYCTWPSEESSARAAAILNELGYPQATAILGGMDAWEEAGFPLTSGS